MRVLVSWLRELVAVTDSAEEIARKMSLRGFAVEGIETIGSDSVLDFEVTANRPDCMSMVGMAREVAVAYGLPLNSVREADPTASVAPRAGDPPGIDIVIEDAQLCPRYVGGAADVTIAASPSWMQARLQAAGIRPISNIVDVTNYVLLELGHPMHAFDLTRLTKAQIRVRTARAGETIKTLDGQTRTLSADMLVIADAERPVAIAGVMGGAESEVSSTTTTIVLESAYFNPLSVRRTSKKLGLKTEASMRFERGADPALAAGAMARAIALIEEVGAGKGRGAVVDEQPKRIGPHIMGLRRDRVGGLLGGDVPDADIERILRGLGFELKTTSSGWDVTVPTRRVDVTREVDLIEEVARHYGFDRLPVTFPALTQAPRPTDPRIAVARRIRGLMTAAGFSEALTFGFTSSSAASCFALPGKSVVEIKNPLSESFNVLRPSLLPGLIEAAGTNVRRDRRDVRLFELGNRFSKEDGERLTLAFIWTGSSRNLHWGEPARDVNFFDVKGVVTEFCDAHDAAVHVQNLPKPPAFLVAGKAAAVIGRPKHSTGVTAGAHLGLVGQLSDHVADSLGLPKSSPAFLAELDVEETRRFQRESWKLEPLPKYPSVTRDISILVDDALAAADIRDTVRGAAPAILVRVAEFDRYHGKGVPGGKVSLSLRLTFRSSDRTLTDAEVQAAMDAVMTALKNRHAAIQR